MHYRCLLLYYLTIQRHSIATFYYGWAWMFILSFRKYWPRFMIYLEIHSDIACIMSIVKYTHLVRSFECNTVRTKYCVKWVWILRQTTMLYHYFQAIHWRSWRIWRTNSAACVISYTMICVESYSVSWNKNTNLEILKYRIWLLLVSSCHVICLHSVFVVVDVLIEDLYASSPMCPWKGGGSERHIVALHNVLRPLIV